MRDSEKRAAKALLKLRERLDEIIRELESEIAEVAMSSLADEVGGGEPDEPQAKVMENQPAREHGAAGR